MSLVVQLWEPLAPKGESLTAQPLPSPLLGRFSSAYPSVFSVPARGTSNQSSNYLLQALTATHTLSHC